MFFDFVTVPTRVDDSEPSPTTGASWAESPLFVAIATVAGRRTELVEAARVMTNTASERGLNADASCAARLFSDTRRGAVRSVANDDTTIASFLKEEEEEYGVS